MRVVLQNISVGLYLLAKQAKWVAFLCLLLGTNVLLLAQKISVNTTSINTDTDGHFELVYTVEGENIKINNLQPPDFSDFDILDRGQTSNQSIFNMFGNRQAKFVYKFTYVLHARKAGTTVIPPMELPLGRGKSVKSKPVRVSAKQGKKKNKQVIPDEELAFIRVLPDTVPRYQGEQLVVVFRLYSRFKQPSEELLAPPLFPGFYAQAVTLNNSFRGIEKVNGKDYYTYDFAMYALFAQRSGKMTIDPMETKITIFQPQFGYQAKYSPRELIIKTKPVDVEIKPLPQVNKPPTFNGSTGQYKLNVTADKREVEANGSLTMTVTIEGTGHVKLIYPPILDDGNGFYDIMEPNVKDVKLEWRDEKVYSIRRFVYTIIPSAEGRRPFPKVSFSYFDYETEEYKTLNSQGTMLTILPGKQRAEVQEKAYKGPDGLYPLSATPNHLSKKTGWQLYASIPFIALLCLPMFILPFIRQRHIKEMAEKADVIGRKRRMATSVAIEKLKQAEVLKNKGDKPAFYNEVIRSIWGYLDDKLGMTTAQLSKANIEKVLSDRDVAQTHIKQLLSTIDYCEMALFAPVKNADQLQQTYDRAVALISDLDRELSYAEKSEL